MAQHAFFHKSVAGADGDAMAARNAARFSDRGSAVPKHAWIRIFPVDGERFIDFNVLTSLNAPAAKNALIRIVTIKRICVIDFVRFRSEWDSLMLNRQQFRRVVDYAIAIVVVTDRAVQHVVAEDAIESFHLGCRCLR